MKEALCTHLRGAVCTSIPAGELSELHELTVEGELTALPLCTRPTEGTVQKNHCAQYVSHDQQAIPVSEIQ